MTASPLADLLAAPEAVVTVGAPTLDEALAAQGVATVPVEWRPPPADRLARPRGASPTTASPLADLPAAPDAAVTGAGPTIGDAPGAQGVRAIPVAWRPPPAALASGEAAP